MFKKFLNLRWMKFLIMAPKYQKEFPPEKLTKDLFYWSYLFVSTRTFGQSIPYVSLIPLSDLLNHSNYTLTSGIVNKKLELEEDDDDDECSYKKKKNIINLNIFKEPLLYPKK